MKKTAKESGQGLVEYALILVLVAIVVIAVLMLVMSPRTRFVEAIDAGTVQISGTKITLGESGHPQPVDPGIRVANYFLGPLVTLESYQIEIQVTGCMNLYLSEDTEVFAATPVDKAVAILIDIQTPAQGGGYVQVCVPDGLSNVPVYLWSGTEVQP